MLFRSGDVVLATTPEASIAALPADMQAAARAAQAIVGHKKPWKEQLKANLLGLGFRVQWVDRLAALEALVKRGMSKGMVDSLKAADTMYFLRMADQRHAFVAEIATNGALSINHVKRADGQVERIVESKRGASLKQIAQVLQASGIKDPKLAGDLFTAYLAAKRAKQVGLNKLNFSGKVTQQMLDEAERFGEANEAFKEARRLYNEYNKGLVSFLEESGVLSKEKAAELSAQDYVPFYRIRDRKSTRLNSSHIPLSRMPSSA